MTFSFEEVFLFWRQKIYLQLALKYLQVGLGDDVFREKGGISECQSRLIKWIFASIEWEFTGIQSVFATFEVEFATRKHRICNWTEKTCNSEKFTCNGRRKTWKYFKILATVKPILATSINTDSQIHFNFPYVPNQFLNSKFHSSKCVIHALINQHILPISLQLPVIIVLQNFRREVKFLINDGSNPFNISLINFLSGIQMKLISNRVIIPFIRDEAMISKNDKRRCVWKYISPH